MKTAATDTPTLRRKSDSIESCIAAGRWRRARRLILEEMKADPENHWLLTRLSTTFYEERNYAKALEISRTAYTISPKCPLVLWDYAGALEMAGKEHEAIGMWNSMLRRGVQSIAKDKCGEGVQWARSLLNDCRYRLAVAYLDAKQYALAERHILAHKARRRTGLSSCYTAKDVARQMKRLGKRSVR